jgi:hypothetical protein
MVPSVQNRFNDVRMVRPPTHYAPHLMTDAHAASIDSKTRIPIARAVAYLRAKQSFNGGFCFYKFAYLDQPTLHDTYHALQALQLSGATIPHDQEVLRYLNQTEPLDSSELFYSVFSLDSLGQFSRVPPAHGARAQTLIIRRLETAAQVDATRWLESTLQTVQLQLRFAAPTDTAAILSGIDNLKHEGGYGEKANLQDTALGLRILTLLGEQLHNLRETRAFVDRLQRRFSGFTNTADSLSVNLDIVAAGIESCALLNLPVRHREDILEFVLACQAADGSFSPVPVALPNIALTHQAIKVIHALRITEQSIRD